jgi:hypothetical protein
MSRNIYFWHGRDAKIVEKIAKICRYEASDECYWDGTLDDFEKVYGGKFIVYPGQICVTQFSNFGQR